MKFIEHPPTVIVEPHDDLDNLIAFFAHCARMMGKRVNVNVEDKPVKKNKATKKNAKTKALKKAKSKVKR